MKEGQKTTQSNQPHAPKDGKADSKSQSSQKMSKGANSVTASGKQGAGTGRQDAGKKRH